MFRARPLRRIAVVLAMLLLSVPAAACDICAVYTGFELQATDTGPRFGLAEQFTRFGTLQQSSRSVANPNDEYMNSSITQLLVGYQFHPRFGAQVIVPVISRSFRRLTASGVQSGDVSGFGDLSVVGNFLAYNHTSEDTVVLVTLLGGLQLPSGNSHPLSEELPEPSTPTACPEPITRECLVEQAGGFAAAHAGHGHDDVQSGVHGHDLALGSGAVDVLMGVRTFASWKRLYGDVSLQYSLRSVGSFGYRYANELIVAGGPGGFLLAHDDYTLGAHALLTLETKGNDTVQGQPTGDTGFTGLYVGPAFHFTWTNKLSLDLAADLPAIQNNTGLQIVPDWRLRLGAVWRF